MWYRVFCRSSADLPAADVLAGLPNFPSGLRPQVRGDDLGWTAMELHLGPGTPIYVEHFLTDQDDLRNDLNTWAAFLETLDYSPNNGLLMEWVIQTRQLFTIRRPLDHPNESAVEDLCLAAARQFARTLDGVYQVEDDGWYRPDGDLILKEY